MVDLSIIFKHEGTEQAIDEKLDLKEFEYSGQTYYFSQPVHIAGTFKNIGFNKIEFDFTVKCIINVQCSRCNKAMQYHLTVEGNEILKQVEFIDLNEDSDEIVVHSHVLDISDILLNTIMVHMDTKFLCKNDCKGLCSICGCDLNENTCDCKKDNIDPRLAILKDLL